MLERLSDRLQKVLKDLKGEGRVSEAHLDATLREIRLALLEADVHFQVVKQFVARIREKALGREVLRSLTPGQQVVKIVRDELVALLGGESARLLFSKVPPSVYMMVGLQGSGKTTTTGKLALHLLGMGRRPLLVSTDVYRPAALEQLTTVARQIDVPVFEDSSSEPLERALRALEQARNMGYDVLLLDTAGRLHIDEALMVELEEIEKQLKPAEVLLVADAMTGQDAVKSAGEFARRLDLSGIILSKMDGDARGGAALSLRQVTGKPVKFMGVGERYTALEPFHPARVAGRILGMGDVLGLIERAEEAVDQEEAAKFLGKLQREEFTLLDFRSQLRQIRKLGPLEQVLEMLPRAGPLKGLGSLQVGEKDLVHLEAIIDSMTPRERHNVRIINGSRRKRIAAGSGRPVSEVNRLLKHYMQTRKMMKRLGKSFFGKGLSKLRLPL